MAGVFPDTPDEIEMKEMPAKRTPPDEFETVPVLSVRRGWPVEPLIDGFKKFKTNIEDSIEKLVSKYPKLLIVDYDGLILNKPQLDLFQDIQNYAQDNDKDLDLWVEAGVRIADGTIDLFVAGANSVVISTSLIANFNELKKATEMSGDLILSLDFGRNGLVSERDILGGKSLEWFISNCSKSGINKFFLDTVVTDQDTIKTENDLFDFDTELSKLDLKSQIYSFYVHKNSNTVKNGIDSLKSNGIKGILLDITEEDLEKIKTDENKD